MRSVDDARAGSRHREWLGEVLLPAGLAALAASVAVCAGGVRAQELTVRIGHVAQISGTFSVIGKNIENGARQAIDELNARGVIIGGRRARFELVAVNDNADPAQSAVVAQALVDAAVQGVVGHFYSSSSIAASKVYCAAGIPQITATATAVEFTRSGCKWSFRVIADDQQIGGALGHYARQTMGVSSIAVVDDGSAYGRSIGDVFASAVAAAGATVVAVQHIDARATDLTPMLAAVKAKNPDLVFFGGYAPQAGLLIQQMKQVGLQARLMGGDAICQADLPQRAGDAWVDSRVVCALPGGAEFNTPAMARFRDDYKRRFGEDPIRYSPYAYDAVRVMVDAMVRAGSPDPAKVLPALATTRDFMGVTGAISFDERGDIRNAGVTIFSFKNRKREPSATVP